MNSTRYELELEKLYDSYESALTADVTPLKVAITGASDSSVIAVGSGGSFTVASLLCNLHEYYTGRVSRPSTPIEIICNPSLSSSSPVFFISAEGKNPDIVEALLRARLYSARPLHILTNRNIAPLTDAAKRVGGVSTHIYQLTEKDGYLATNSLLVDAVLVARAYSELDRETDAFPANPKELTLHEHDIDTWLEQLTTFTTEAVKRGTMIVVYSPLLRPLAADLESKLSESALLNCQAVDVRSFAHGRHLWLADRADDVVVLAFVEPTVTGLWSAMQQYIPDQVPVASMPLSGARPRDLIAGLFAELKLVGRIALAAGKDPGHPNVPDFGRSLHYLDIGPLIPAPEQPPYGAEQSKSAVWGAHWPSNRKLGLVVRAAEAYRLALCSQVFRAVVFDYDGTLASSHQRDVPPSSDIADQLTRLSKAGVTIGIASGRGKSIHEHLRECFPKEYWANIYLGLYNCGVICDLNDVPPDALETSEFLSHVNRIVVKLKQLGAPIETVRVTHPFQVSVRLKEGVQSEPTWFVIADALRHAGLDPSAIVRSKHSVDILAPGVNKARLVAHVIQKGTIEPFQLLTIGDQGAWPGNDSALLEHRFSLSVDEPARRLDRGWKFAPAHKRDVDATLWYLERVEVVGTGQFVIRIDQ